MPAASFSPPLSIPSAHILVSKRCLTCEVGGGQKGGGEVGRTSRRDLPQKTVADLAHRNRSDFCDLRLRCPSRTPEIARFPRQEKAMLRCDLRVRWKVASDLRFRAAISEPKIPSFCGISGDLAPSTRKSLAIAIVRFWCAKVADLPHLSTFCPSPPHAMALINSLGDSQN